jgi:hypothetical protein
MPKVTASWITPATGILNGDHSTSSNIIDQSTAQLLQHLGYRLQHIMSHEATAVLFQAMLSATAS